MENEDQYKQLESSFKRLDKEGKRYILGILQALEFAQSNQVVGVTKPKKKDGEKED
ncbi:hypothetical protein [Lysinibacillus capsici]|uniref:hypothetical protein n=1 Tax=Lysinibacillus capsici TaxID=2115968 RepID=UPI00289F2328|nr:hypothetical protein [Lysinibacillus capsici]